MKKMLFGLLFIVIMSGFGCGKMPVPVETTDDVVEEEVIEEIPEISEEVDDSLEEFETMEEIICDNVKQRYDLTVTFDGAETYILKVDKSVNDYLGDGTDLDKVVAGTTEVLKISKDVYDYIDSISTDEFYFMLVTKDDMNVSIFKTSDGTYYTNCFGTTIENITDYVN